MSLLPSRAPLRSPDHSPSGLHLEGQRNAAVVADLARAARRLPFGAAAIDPDCSDPLEALAALFEQRDVAQATVWSTRALELKLKQSGGLPSGPVPAAAQEGQRTRDVVSFSLWGALEAYCAGAVANARLWPAMLPGWTCRFHHDGAVPSHILAELASLGAGLVAMPEGSAARQGMFWCFLPADDPAVRRFLCRDCDSRPTAREIAAVQAWIASGLPFHVMRDHVMHMEPVMGDVALNTDAGIGAHALAFEESPGLFGCLVRTVAANGLDNVVARQGSATAWNPASEVVDIARLRLVRATVGRTAIGGAGDPLDGPLARAIAEHRPVLHLRIEDDAGAAGAFTRLRNLGYRLWWHLVPVFNPGNRFGVVANPFPGLVSVNALGLPPGHEPPPRSLVEIREPDAGWTDAAWRLTCDGR